MKIKILNLTDAFRLAHIVSKYVDIDSVSPETNALDFIGDIVNKISPEEFLYCISLMTNKTDKKIKKEKSLIVLTAFIKGLKENQIVSLLLFYKSIGIKHDPQSR